MKHYFHCVLKSDLKCDLQDLAHRLNKKPAEVVNLIFDSLFYKLDKYIFAIEDLKNKNYEEFGADADIFINLEIGNYNKIKEMHSALQTFSMAIIFRHIVEVFIEGVKEHGFDGFMKILEKEEKATKKRILEKFSIKKSSSFAHILDTSTKNTKFLFVFDDIYSFQGAKVIKD